MGLYKVYESLPRAMFSALSTVPAGVGYYSWWNAGASKENWSSLDNLVPASPFSTVQKTINFSSK
jgi:hypothetical protein